MLEFLENRPNKMIELLDDLQRRKEPIYLFGAGNCGEEYQRALRGKGIEIEAFLDDDREKQERGFCGKEVLPPEVMVDRKGIILISSYGPTPLIKRLEKIHPALVKRVVWSELYLWEGGLDYFAYYQEHSSELETVYGMLNDERSKEVFRNLLNYKISRDIGLIEQINDFTHHDQYFDRSILPLGKDEVFVDLGAYNGDTVDAFVRHVGNAGGSYSHIYAFEPDPQTFRQLEDRTSKYERVSCINKGAWKEDTVLRFTSEGFWTSSFDERGNIEVPVCAIDTEIGSRVTLIKADIEGSEMEALHGAEKTIRAYKPSMVFCIYHRKEDIFHIPLYLKELNPAYQFYMRQYSEIPVESVVYAIDRNRAAAAR